MRQFFLVLAVVAEDDQVFEIYDPDNRQKFWHYFVRQHPFQVPGKNIAFEKPWWLQKR